MDTSRARIIRAACLTACMSALAACGGGSSSSNSSSVTLTPPAAPLVQVSQASPYATNCHTSPGGATLYEGAVVEPYEAVNPTNPANVIGIWQQDRWSGGGAHGLVAAYSMDGAKTWTEQGLPLSACGGGSYDRASDPWVSFGPTGTAYLVSISFSGTSMTAQGGSGGVLVQRSTDGGVTWGAPTPLIADGNSAFDDKESVTADPNDSHYAYVVWDRLDTGGFGPTYFSRTTDGGSTWSAGQPIYDPGMSNQTIGNEIIGLTDGSIVDLFEEIDSQVNQPFSTTINVIRSTDHGATWSLPVMVARDLAVGTVDPDTGLGVRSGAGLPQGTAAPGGGLVVVWQDGRFNGGYDGIALSRSTDAGQTWSAPVEVNRVTSVQAFTPSVAVLGDGTIGVTYFDFRNNTPDKTTLPTDYWFASSTDAVHWNEQHISGSFDLDQAPNAEGLFLGDYQGLAVVANVFTPFYVQTTGTGANSTDVYALPPQPVPLKLTQRVTHLSVTAPAVTPDSAFRARVSRNALQLMRHENPREDLSKKEGSGTAPP